MSLAQWSNLFVYASMAVYTVAMVAFAGSFAASRAGASPRSGGASGVPLGDDPRPVAVVVGPPDAHADAQSSFGRRAADGSTREWPVEGATAAEAAARARALARERSPLIEAEMAAEARRARRPHRGAGAGAGASGGELLPPGRRAANVGMALTWLAFGLILGGIVLRAAWAGRAPWGNMYEYSLASAAAITGVFLGVSLRRDVRWMGLLVTMASLITLGTAVLLLYNDSPQLVPALKSYWLVIHVAAAIIAGGAFTVGAAATVLYLAADRAQRRPDDRFAGWVAARLPDADTLDALAYRVNAFVFPLWTFAVIAGAIWAEDAWGRYWGWDPKETWAFITWLVYAGYLHARATAGWRGRRAAVVGLVGFACFLINFFGVNLFASGLHSYAGV